MTDRVFGSVVEEHRARIRSVLPGVEVVLTGGALVEGAAASDLDLVVLAEDVPDAAGWLRELYPPLHEDEWSDDWAAFRHPGSPQVDVVVTREGSNSDAHHRRAWELLVRDAFLLAEYRALKDSRDQYEERKAAFFDRVVTLLSNQRVG